MDATHFRQQAQHAREMAKLGDDPLLSRMLLDVAWDLDAEADAMQAEASAASNKPAAPLAPDNHAGIAPAGVFDLAIFAGNIPGAGLTARHDPSIRVVQDAPRTLEHALERS